MEMEIKYSLECSSTQVFPAVYEFDLVLKYHWQASILRGPLQTEQTQPTRSLCTSSLTSYECSPLMRIHGTSVRWGLRLSVASAISSSYLWPVSEEAQSVILLQSSPPFAAHDAPAVSQLGAPSSRQMMKGMAWEYLSQSLRVQVSRMFPQHSLGPCWQMISHSSPFFLRLALPQGQRSKSQIYQKPAVFCAALTCSTINCRLSWQMVWKYRSTFTFCASVWESARCRQPTEAIIARQATATATVNLCICILTSKQI